MYQKIYSKFNHMKHNSIVYFKYYFARFRARKVISESYDAYHAWEKKRGFITQRMLFELRHGHPLNLQSPKSFSEKLVHRRLFSRDPIWPVVTNKIAVKKWIMDNNLVQFMELIPELRVFKNPEDINFDEIKKPCVIKAAWASGYNIFIKDNNANWGEIKIALKAWAATPYAVHRLIWAPHQMPREFLVEEMLLNASGEPPEDFKFYVFDGHVEVIQIHISRFSNHSHIYFNRNLERLDISRGKRIAREYVLPEEIHKLIKAAEQIGKHFDFARIDLYLHNSKVYFGEITQTPANGFVPFRPRTFEFELGEKWNYEPAKN